MKDHEPTITSRTLGYGLYTAMTSAGAHASQMAELLGCSPSKISRMLSGKRHGSVEDVAAFLAICGVVGTQRDRLLALARGCTQQGSWQDHGRCFQARFTLSTALTLRTLDIDARTIAIYNPTWVPGLLHTVDYTRGLLQAIPAFPTDEIDPVDEIDRQVALCHQRQTIIDHHPPPDLRFFVGERAITHSYLDQQLMSDQVHHLIRMGVRPHVDIRIIPESATLPSACPPFQFFTFKDLRSVVYLKNLTSTEFLEHAGSVAVYRRVLDELEGAALDRERSRDWLVQLGQLWGPSRDVVRTAPPRPARSRISATTRRDEDATVRVLQLPEASRRLN